MNMIPDGQKKVIFDSDVYIKSLNNGLIENIKHRESNKNIFAYAFPWVILELMQNVNDKALDVLKKHCYDSVNNLVRIIADPIAQIYNEIYGRQSKLCAHMFNCLITFLHSNSEERKKVDISEKLKRSGRLFSEGFPAQIKVMQLKKEETAIKRKCAEDIVNFCIAIDMHEEKKKVIDKNKAINFVVENFPLPLAYYNKLLLRKATQKHINRKKLYHDQRDWHLLFYAKDFFIITEDRDLLGINAKNIISFEAYRNTILSD